MAVGIFYNKEQLNKSFKLVKWSPNVDYKATNLVVFDNKIYKCITDHTSTDFVTDETNWELYVGNDSFTLKIWTSGENYLIDEYVVYDYKLYQANVDIIGDVDFDITKYDLIIGCDNEEYELWKTDTDYVVGDRVKHNNYVYECIIEHHSDLVDFDNDKDNWIIILSEYISLNKNQYDMLVANGTITAENKNLYIVDDNNDYPSEYEMDFTDLDTVLVQHNLNETFPSKVYIFDEDGNEIVLPEIEYNSMNLLTISFAFPITGKVIVKK